MSIVPSPGPRSTIAPREEFSFIDNVHTVADGTVIYQTADSAVFRGFNSTVINHGTIWLEHSFPQAWLVAGGRSNVENTGLIYIRADSQVALSPEIENFTNSGSVFVISDSGWARGVEGGAYRLIVDNSAACRPIPWDRPYLSRILECDRD